MDEQELRDLAADQHREMVWRECLCEALALLDDERERSGIAAREAMQYTHTRLKDLEARKQKLATRLAELEAENACLQLQAQDAEGLLRRSLEKDVTA
jgi:hypothetical protein